MSIKRFETCFGTTSLVDFIARDFGKFNRVWHRDFCYSPTLCDALILSVLCNASIGEFACTRKILVDGAQRITTLRLFRDNQFSVNIKGKQHFYKDLPKTPKRLFDDYKIHFTELTTEDEEELMQYHYMVNMNGYRSKIHRKKLASLIKDIYDRKNVRK